MIAMAIESKLGPAEVLKIVVSRGLPQQVVNGCGHARLITVSLKSQQHEGRRSRNRIGSAAQNRAVAVVDAAVVKGPVQKETQAFPDARVIAKTGTSQSQTSPGGRLDPGEISLRPSPTG